MKLLVSVRNVDEALAVAAHGADFIDLKEPSNGALGGLPVAVIVQIMQALRTAGVGLPISATVGDLPMHELARIQDQVRAVAACGVTYVKVGVEAGAGAHQLLDWLARCGHAVVPVFIADRGVDHALLAHALALGFPGVMADTADKLAGSLFDAVPAPDLERFVATARHAGCMVGLAGALRLQHLPALARLAPDFAGFRSAVCVQGERAGDLDAQRVAALRSSVVQALNDARTKATPVAAS